MLGGANNQCIAIDIIRSLIARDQSRRDERRLRWPYCPLGVRIEIHMSKLGAPEAFGVLPCRFEANTSVRPSCERLGVMAPATLSSATYTAGPRVSPSRVTGA